MSRRLLDQQPDRGAGVRVVHLLQGRSVACGFVSSHITATMNLPRVTCRDCVRVAAEGDAVLERMEARR